MKTSQKLRALIVDGDKAIRRRLKAALVSDEYSVFEALNAAEALKKSVSSHPDVIILDLRLPDGDGMDVIRDIRKRSRIPMIVISVRQGIEDKLTALDAGADDYLTKPFETREVLARLRAIMRRLVPIGEQTVFKAGGLTVDVAKHRIERNGQPLSLTPKEYDILKTLVLNAGIVLTHRHLLTEIWDKSDRLPKNTHLLRATIKNLRDKIEPDPSRPAYIFNVQGVGYRFADDEDKTKRSGKRA